MLAHLIRSALQSHIQACEETMNFAVQSLCRSNSQGPIISIWQTCTNDDISFAHVHFNRHLLAHIFPGKT